MNYKVNGRRIRQERIINGLSKQELAAKAGVAYITVYKLEEEQNNPHPKTIRKVCDALGISIKEVLQFSSI